MSLAKASHRLNLAGGVNSFGTTIGPIVVALIIFGSTPLSGEELELMVKNNEIKLNTIQSLYLGVAALFLAAAALFYFSKRLPQSNSDAAFQPANKAKNLLIVLSVFMIACFTIVFMSYGEYEIFKVENIENVRLFLLIASLLAVVFCTFYAYKSSSVNPTGWGAMQYPQLVLGMLAIFTYVGV